MNALKAWLGDEEAIDLASEEPLTKEEYDLICKYMFRIQPFTKGMLRIETYGASGNYWRAYVILNDGTHSDFFDLLKRGLHNKVLRNAIPDLKRQATELEQKAKEQEKQRKAAIEAVRQEQKEQLEKALLASL